LIELLRHFVNCDANFFIFMQKRLKYWLATAMAWQKRQVNVHASMCGDFPKRLRNKLIAQHKKKIGGEGGQLREQFRIVQPSGGP
jgi:hypothetical protein